MSVTIRRAVFPVCGALLTALSCGEEAPPPESDPHTLNSGCLHPTGVSTPALEPDDAWLGGVTAAGDTVRLMVTRDAEIRASATPLFPLTLEFRSETLADTERYTRMELGWGATDLKYVEVPKAPTTHQIAIPRTLLGQQEATLRIHATSIRPGRKHTMRGYLLLSETSAFWGPLWGTDACSETLIVRENEELTVFLPASQRQWLGFDARARDGGGRLRVDVLSDVGDRISLGTTAVGTAAEFRWEGWEWSHSKSERQRVTFVPEDATVSITLRKAVFDPPIDKVVWSARRILRARRPPIVVVLLDAFRSDRWGARNDGRSVTPRLDELAKRGVLFRNARCHVPYTRGSMPTILTGCYPPEETGIRRKLRHDTLASVLQDAGYATVAVSSNPFLRSGTELDVGFDLVIDVDAWLRNRATEGSRYWAQQALDPLIETLFILGDQPFLIFLHLMQPHGPYCPPAPYDTLYTVSDPGRLRDLEPLGPERLQDLAWNVTDEECAYLRERYDGNVSYADHVVGLILEVLETFGPEREPILVVLSDHGEALMEHGIAGHSHGQLYEESITVPLLLCGPGLSRGLEPTSAVRLVDVTPTLLELAGSTIPENMDGMSLVGIARGDSVAADTQPVFAVSKPARHDPLRVAAYRWPWKYILTEQLARGCVSEQEIYDLSRDPGETTNLVSYHSELCSEFRALCAGWLGKKLPEVAPSADGLSDEELGRLEALGYVSP